MEFDYKPIKLLSILMIVVMLFVMVPMGEVEAATIPVGSGETYTTIQGAVDNASSGDVIEVQADTYEESVDISLASTSRSNLTIKLLDGVVIAPTTGSCFTISDSSIVRIQAVSPGGAVCQPTTDGIEVGEAVTNLTIEKLEIDGQDTATGHGINFSGSTTPIDGLIVNDNYIHNMGVDGVHFGATPSGYFEVKGNLFKDNAGVGVEATGDLDVTYNSWGHYDGPVSGDGVSTNILEASYTPWTHADVYVGGGADSRYLDEVAIGDATPEEITYSVYANLQNAYSGQFTLSFDETILHVAAIDTSTTVFPLAMSISTVEEANTSGEIAFYGGSETPVSNTDQLLFSVTFTGATPTSELNPLFFDAEDQVLFGMNPGAESSSSLIYANAMVGITDVNVYDLPTIDITPTDGFSVANPKDFTLTVTNPTTGRAYTDLNVDMSYPGDAILEYWDGDSFETYTTSVTIGDGSLAAPDTATQDFQITFNTSGSNDVTATLYDTAILLVADTFPFTVGDSYTVTGTIRMQGQTNWSGVPMNLFGDVTGYSYDSTSVDQMSSNISFTTVAVDTYTITTSQDRYLNAPGNIFNFTGTETIPVLYLYGGNANNDTEISIDDASIIGANYGDLWTIPEADVNFDGVVNIQDLAMVGGNYGTDDSIYGSSWLPEPEVP